MNMIVGSMLGNPLGGISDGLTGGDGNEGEKAGEDPEVVAARLEQEERRKEKHRKAEAEREKMREGIRSKYNIQKKEDNVAMDFTEGRVGAVRKTPEQLAAEKAREESIIGQLGMTEHVDKAKATLTSAFETVKGFLPFGK